MTLTIYITPSSKQQKSEHSMSFPSFNFQSEEHLTQSDLVPNKKIPPVIQWDKREVANKANDSSIITCRNSVQGKTLITDDRGVCNNMHLVIQPLIHFIFVFSADEPFYFFFFLFCRLCVWERACRDKRMLWHINPQHNTIQLRLLWRQRVLCRVWELCVLLPSTRKGIRRRVMWKSGLAGLQSSSWCFWSHLWQVFSCCFHFFLFPASTASEDPG